MLGRTGGRFFLRVVTSSGALDFSRDDAVAAVASVRHAALERKPTCLVPRTDMSNRSSPVGRLKGVLAMFEKAVGSVTHL